MSLVGAAVLPACWQGPHDSPAGLRAPARPPLQVTATTAIVAELAGRLTGAPEAVQSLLARGERLSQLERTGPRETMLVAAEVIITLGWGLEAPLARSLEKAQEAGAQVVELASFFPADQLLPLPDREDQIDPAVWLDPVMWKEVVTPLLEVFQRLRPEDSERLATNGHMVRFDLESLLERLKNKAVHRTAGLEEVRPLVTKQASVRYLARRLGVEVVIDEPSLSERNDWLEDLKLDTLLPLGSPPGFSRYAEHDLTKLEGLVECAAALLLGA